MDTPAIFIPALLLGICGASVVGLVLAEYRSWPLIVKVIAKMTASTCFVVLALAMGAGQSTYGQWMLAGLILSWCGDAFLLGRSRRIFTAGLAAFLFAHLCFASGFAAGHWDASAATMALLPAALFGAVILRWLGPHLPRAERVPVFSYIFVILAMCASAAGLVSATGVVLPLWGALLFAASDIAVARDRFVAPGWINRAWGLPLYFLAQCLLAISAANGVALV